MTPREFFPNMPDEVFDLWLAPLIQGKGWPFNSITDDLQKTNWRYVLGIDSTLRDWASCSWSLIEINLSEIKLTNSGVNMIKAIIGYCVMGNQTVTANLENTKERFQACTEFFIENGTIPNPVVVKKTRDGIEVIDGHHRLAAIAHVGAPKNLLIPAWITEI